MGPVMAIVMIEPLQRYRIYGGQGSSAKMKDAVRRRFLIVSGLIKSKSRLK